MSARVIAIMNQKGGVGKTTTAINLGAALAALDQRVLLIDLDSQANLSAGLGCRAASIDVSIYAALLEDQPITDIIVKTRWPNLELAPSHIDLAGAEIELFQLLAREKKLLKAIQLVRDAYDFIFIDCQPSLSILVVNAMTAATEIFIPLQAHPFALEGTGKLIEMIRMVRETLNPDLKLSGVLLTMEDIRTKLGRSILEKIRETPELKAALFDTRVRQNISIAESQRHGTPIIHFDSNSHGAKAYMKLAYEVLRIDDGEDNNAMDETDASEPMTASERLGAVEAEPLISPEPDALPQTKSEPEPELVVKEIVTSTAQDSAQTVAPAAPKKSNRVEPDYRAASGSNRSSLDAIAESLAKIRKMRDNDGK
ncbi:MAG: AAA family ATPase [Planctomycetota bacterium]